MPELPSCGRLRAPVAGRPLGAACSGRGAPWASLSGGGKLLADSIAEDDPLRPTGSSSATRVKAQAGDKGARVLRWTAGFRRAVDAEKDPKVQAQLIFYLNQQLLKSYICGTTAWPARVLELVTGGPFVGQVEAQDRAALHAFRAKNGLTEATTRTARGPGLDDGGLAVGARLDLEGTTSALRALLAKAAPRSAAAAPMKPAAL